jgi:hypothetical protein
VSALQELRRALKELRIHHASQSAGTLSAISELVEASADLFSTSSGIPRSTAVAAQADHYALVLAEARKREFSTFENEAMWEGVLAHVQERTMRASEG